MTLNCMCLWSPAATKNPESPNCEAAPLPFGFFNDFLGDHLLLLAEYGVLTSLEVVLHDKGSMAVAGPFLGIRLQSPQPRFSVLWAKGFKRQNPSTRAVPRGLRRRHTSLCQKAREARQARGLRELVSLS